MITDDKVLSLKAKLEKDREQIASNLAAINGAIQALDILLKPDPVDVNEAVNEAIPAG